MLEPLTCPKCGAPLRAGANKCDYCNVGFVNRKIEAKLIQCEAEIKKIEFEITQQEMAAALAREAKPRLYAYDRPIGGI